MTNRARWIMGFTVYLCLLAGAANAYIDMGSGSLLLQFLFGGLFGALFLLRRYVARAVEFIRRLFRGKSSPKEDGC